MIDRIVKKITLSVSPFRQVSTPRLKGDVIRYFKRFWDGQDFYLGLRLHLKLYMKEAQIGKLVGAGGGLVGWY